MKSYKEFKKKITKNWSNGLIDQFLTEASISISELIILDLH